MCNGELEGFLRVLSLHGLDRCVLRAVGACEVCTKQSDFCKRTWQSSASSTLSPKPSTSRSVSLSGSPFGSLLPRSAGAWRGRNKGLPGLGVRSEGVWGFRGLGGLGLGFFSLGFGVHVPAVVAAVVCVDTYSWFQCVVVVLVVSISW